MGAVGIHLGATTTVVTGGTAVTALLGPMLGGFVTNPSSPTDQGGIDPPEKLYVSYVDPASTSGVPTTITLLPGATCVLPADLQSDVTVNAATSGHRFSAVVLQAVPPYPPSPGPSPFPPIGPTTVLGTIPSYLYVQYNDDEDLQAFVDAFNELSQSEVDWFNETPLPVYTSDAIVGLLLDLVALGLYGLARPSLSTGKTHVTGPLNTFQLNGIPFNYFAILGAEPFFATSDDTFKRILTWLFYKGDGKYFNIKWLKRRIMRFLNGMNGTDPPVDQTYAVSVTFGAGNQVNVSVNVSAPLLVDAASSGVLELPFQFDFVFTDA